jgi:hypothetical protein
MSDSKFQARENSGVLFYDAPGAPTMAGSVQRGKDIKITAEPAVDKNQKDYLRIVGDGVSGGLYENERKTKDNQPDYVGPCSFNREEMRVSAWKKEAKSGKNAGSTFLSLAFSEKLPPRQDG